jgi:hypothetical protein
MKLTTAPTVPCPLLEIILSMKKSPSRQGFFTGSLSHFTAEGVFNSLKKTRAGLSLLHAIFDIRYRAAQ